MIRLRLPAIVDASTSSELPEPTGPAGLVIDFTDCHLFGADGYAWLGRLLTVGLRVRLEHVPAPVGELVQLLVPAHLDDGELRLV